MGDDVKRISDPEQVARLARDLFLKRPVSLQDKEGTHPVRIQAGKDGRYFLVHNRPESPVRLVSLNHGQNQLFLECHVKTRNPEGIETVEPLRVHIRKQIRRHERVRLSGTGSLVPWVQEAISLKSLPESMSGYNPRRDSLLKKYELSLQQLYPETTLVPRKTFRMDHRMRTISNIFRPIFVPVRSAPNSIDAAHYVPYEEVKKIFQFDRIPDEVVSEITEPIWFKDQYLMGYIRVWSRETLSTEDYQKIARFTRELENDFVSNGFILRNPERSPVVDINFTGVGFMHPHNVSIIRNFSPGEHIIFDIHFPGGGSETFQGVIRNMKSLEKAHRIGVEFDSVTEDQKELIQTYIDDLARRKSEEKSRSEETNS